MPQLDFSTYPTQIFWLVVCFVILYFLMSRVALPRVATVVQNREKRIQADIERADRLKQEADHAKLAYEKTLTDARAKAQAELAAAAQTIQAEAGKRETAFMAQLNQRTKSAEDAIAASKTKALGEVRELAGGVVASVVNKVAGIEATPGEIAGMVDAVSSKRT